MIRIKIKGEFTFGLPLHYEEIELEEPTFEALMDYYRVDPKIRSHLLPVVNNKITTLDQKLQTGDAVILQSPYAGG
jgi:molybdopterin converting factor small subunit